jgi:hypothetical protein
VRRLARSQRWEKRLLRFKQFVGTGEKLENTVNEWLENNEPDINQMVQTVDGHSTVTLSFLFEESFRGQELRYAEESGMSAAVDPAVPADTIPDKPIQVPMEP